MQAEGRQTRKDNAVFQWLGLLAPTRADRGFFPRRLLVPFVFSLTFPFFAGFIDGLFDLTPKNPLSDEAMIARNIVFAILSGSFIAVAIFYIYQWWKSLDELERAIEGAVAVCVCGAAWILYIISVYGADFYAIKFHEDVGLFMALPAYLVIRAIVRWRLKAL